ncbi:MAG: DNA adenine methylase [Ignavibacteriales bacterium]|nr:DNA adenine methylase [Ignavibacteriales bacterium]
MNTKRLKSVLRYPGGKVRAIEFLMPFFPGKYKEYREPFVGGGSVLISLLQKKTSFENFWINDLNYDLYCFWKYAKVDGQKLIEAIQTIKNNCLDGRNLFNNYTQVNVGYADFERAVRFFILNRITFSGTVDSGGYSQKAFETRFTQSSIDRLRLLPSLLNKVKITHCDYEGVVKENGENVFLFLDPPYFSATKSKLYGKNGDLHISFDHERFAEVMKDCSHRWLITYDDSPEIKKLFNFAYQYPWELQYGMNNYKKDSAEIGKELLIANYDITPIKMGI